LDSPSMVFLVELDRSQFQMLQIEHISGHTLRPLVVRAAGFWIIGSKRLVSSIIHKCITCRKLKGKTEQQIMADFPTSNGGKSDDGVYECR
jgi:hypothetical protein